MNQITITADNITIKARIGGAEQQAPKKKEMPRVMSKSAIYIERYDDVRRIESSISASSICKDIKDSTKGVKQPGARLPLDE